jgi:hypothetical protein
MMFTTCYRSVRSRSLGPLLVLSAATLVACVTADDDSTSSGRSAEDALHTRVFAIPVNMEWDNSPNVPVTIGDQTFSLQLDTASTTLAVASPSCPGCGVGNKGYVPGPTAVDEHEKGSTGYVIGGWSGEIYQDSVSMGTTPSVPVRFVDILKSDAFFGPPPNGIGNAQGIIGLAPAADEVTGTNGIMDVLVADGDIANVFATSLGDAHGTLWLGGYDPTAVAAPPQYTPWLGGPNIWDYFYPVKLDSVEVAGVTVTLPSQEPGNPAGVSAIDTGTTYFTLGTGPINHVANALAASPTVAHIFGEALHTSDPTAIAKFFAQTFVNGNVQNNCVPLPVSEEDLARTLPAMTIHIDPSISVTAPATESYLRKSPSGWCSALLELNPSDLGGTISIVGSPVLRSSVVIFDRKNKRMGFAPRRTPE